MIQARLAVERPSQPAQIPGRDWIDRVPSQMDATGQRDAGIARPLLLRLFFRLQAACAGSGAPAQAACTSRLRTLFGSLFPFMTVPSLQELLESIEALTTYRDRLVADVTAMGQRLKLPQKKVDATLASHAELQRIEAVLAQLISQKDATSSPGSP